MKNCSICGSANLNDFRANDGANAALWCEDCGSMHIEDVDADVGAYASRSGAWYTSAPEKSMLHHQVLAFHKRFGQAIGDTPHVLDPKTMRFRLSLITEEFVEALEASFVPRNSAALAEAKELLVKCVAELPLDVDLPSFVDALADLMYVIEGAAITMGVNMTPILAEVQRTNISKMPSYVAEKDAQHQGAPIKRADGKIEKPPGWQPPNIEEQLTLQGWRK
jgi:predicted HAD superfamily Cof-like phosphohydrolase